MKELREIAKKVRDAIIAASRVERHISFDDFPLGSCRHASLILGTYLEEHGFGNWELVSGEKRTVGEEYESTHAWLMKGSIIIDITASQFEEIDEDVVCCNIDSPWHKQFVDIEYESSNFWCSDEGAHVPLSPLYRKVCQIMNSSDSSNIS